MGTTSVEKSEILAGMLEEEEIPYQVGGWAAGAAEAAGTARMWWPCLLEALRAGLSMLRRAMHRPLSS